MTEQGTSHEENEILSLAKAAQYLLEECRMVLPGMQALFGFRLIAVFSQTFHDHLSKLEQWLHLLALVLVAIAIALVMTRAAIHRKTGARQVTQEFIGKSTRLLLWSMFPLLMGICIDLYLIARIITESGRPALIISAIVFTIFTFLWFISPRKSRPA